MINIFFHLTDVILTRGHDTNIVTHIFKAPAKFTLTRCLNSDEHFRNATMISKFTLSRARCNTHFQSISPDWNSLCLGNICYANETPVTLQLHPESLMIELNCQEYKSKFLTIMISC